MIFHGNALKINRFDFLVALVDNSNKKKSTIENKRVNILETVSKKGYWRYQK